ncbi:MAG: PIN domain-containing protein [bacterium]
MFVPNYFIDSNVFLRPVVKDDKKAADDCEIVLKKLSQEKKKFFTSTLVLAEIIWVGEKFYKIPKADIVIILKGILAIRNLKVIDKFNPIWAIEEYGIMNIKFIDCLLASILFGQRGKMTIVSYDRDFDKIKGLTRVEPQEIINFL